ncbi:PEP-CTERM sorting domain-containing protein [Gloeothece verrucosa]|uniref:PEP-CTERM protein-sorting domain-containing protein n=1 Tax=Gloeothece verrucosa (strain PCC 7822) TaxID=497965 RepID=E0U6R4_GLOV7|nr:PEP-CTERM sorting domain-containing protein [Gloeothece verrucosa]ADN14823.1 conserved hypothetical protein [Gloeothece verrucosa PCC 7822]
MKNLTLLSATAFVTTSGLVFGAMKPASALIWNWSYSGPGLVASGTLTTNDIPDDLGFYLITGITGTRNGETITGLQPAGTPIPGNEPFEVDNLISLNAIQLTGDGFGYSTASGSYASPFYANFLSTPGYLELFSAPPLTEGFTNLGPEDSELLITFSATPVPEPLTILGSVTVLGFGTFFKRKRKPINHLCSSIEKI